VVQDRLDLAAPLVRGGTGLGVETLSLPPRERRPPKAIGFPRRGCYRIGVVLLRRVLLLVLPLLLAVMVAVGARAQGRPDCTRILREMHGRGTPDAAKIASKLDTDSTWVERCAATYGRRVKPKAAKRNEDGPADLTAREEQREFQETAKEERDQQANIVQGDLDNGKPRDRLRGIDPDSSAEWEPYITHEWQPHTGHEWEPFILDDDHPNEE
jgi:hypothetical protein